MPKKKKEAVVDDRPDQLALLIKEATKKYGKGSIDYASKYNHGHLGRITTGILGLDIALGGGLPVGRVSMFYGQEETSKTTCFLRAAGRAQRMCSRCWTPAFPIWTPDYKETKPRCVCGDYRKTMIAWLDVEGVWDNLWSERFMRVDDTLLLSQPETGEQASDVADGLLRSGAVDIIVLDSVAMMTPVEEINKSASESTVGAQARLLGNYFRKLTMGLNSLMARDGRKPSVWLTNQIRYKVGVMFGNPETKPGGQAQKFAASTVTRFTAAKKQVDKETKQCTSRIYKYKGEKNKTSVVKMEEGEYKLVLADTEVKKTGQILDEPYALKLGAAMGLAEVGRAYAAYNGAEYGGHSLLERHWMLNPAEYEDYKAKLMILLQEEGGLFVRKAGEVMDVSEDATDSA